MGVVCTECRWGDSSGMDRLGLLVSVSCGNCFGSSLVRRSLFNVECRLPQPDQTSIGRLVFGASKVDGVKCS